MALDTGIYRQFLTPPKSVDDYDAEARRAEADQLSLLTQRTQVAGQQRAAQRADQLQALMQGLPAGTTNAQRVAALRSGAFFDEADKLESSDLKRAEQQSKLDTEAGTRRKTDYELGRAQFEHTVQGLRSFNNAEDARQWLADSVTQRGMPMAQAQAMMRSIPQDPAAFGDWQNRTILSLADAGKQAGYTMVDANTGAHVAATQRGQDITAATATADRGSREREGAANRGVTMRGQNMTDARARETNAAAVSKPFEVTGPDGTPVLVRQDKQGNITQVEGYGPKSGASKPLTDTQGKALMFGSRMRDSNAVLEDLAAKGVERKGDTKRIAEAVPMVGGALGTMTNWTQSESQQQVEQAQRDFTNAVLRRESGAVISPAEFDNAAQQYFPQPGDTPGVKAQKARNRKLAVDAMLAEVPVGYRNSVGAPAAAGKPAAPSGFKLVGVEGQ